MIHKKLQIDGVVVGSRLAGAESRLASVASAEEAREVEVR